MNFCLRGKDNHVVDNYVFFFCVCVSQANVNSSNWKVMSGMLVAALFPNIVQILTPDTRYAASSAGNA